MILMIDGTAGTRNYTHIGLLVLSNKTVRQSNTTQDGATLQHIPKVTPEKILSY